MNLEVESSASGEILAVYLEVRQGKPEISKEYADGNLFADYDAGGRLVGIEILGPCPPIELAVPERSEP